MMPDPREIAEFEGPENNYPLVHAMSEMFSGEDYETMRGATALHIMTLQHAMGVTD